jgi:histidine triad (HIT) family protein
MSLQGRYDPSNVFARILRGELPKALIFEDDKTLAFMDAFPQSHGHCLVIPKEGEARNLLDAEPGILGPLALTVQKVARAVQAALSPDGIVITQFNGEAAGQTVYHLHLHIIPRWQGEPLRQHGGGMADPGELKATAARIAAEIAP